MNESIKKKICLLYAKKKMSLREISKLMKGRISHETVRTIVADGGVLRKQKRKYINHDNARRMFAKNKSYTETARELNVTPAYIYFIVNGRS